MIKGKTTGKRRWGRSPTKWTNVIAKFHNTKLETDVKESEKRNGATVYFEL